MADTVKDLKELLAGLPDEMKIMISSDSEGNAFKYLSGHCVLHVLDDSCAWEIQAADLDDPEERAYFSEDLEGDEELPDYPKALLLWPVN
jgi:hypothetical protein